MYSAARRPPRVAGARPSRRSLARKRRCASMAAVSTGIAVDRCAPRFVATSASITTAFQHLLGIVSLLPLGTARNGIDPAFAVAGRFAGQHEGRVIKKIDGFAADLQARDDARALTRRQETAADAGMEQIDLRVGPQRNHTAVRAHGPRGDDAARLRARS